MNEKKKDPVTKSWFCVFNNPEQHGYTGTPQEIIGKLMHEWIDDQPTRSGAWIYCVSAEGLKHVHMVLEDEKAMRFSAIKNSYALGMHFEPTRGTKAQAEDYINKRGDFEEKGEIIIAKVQHGEIKGFQGKRRDFETIEELIQSGMTAKEVMNVSIRYRQHEKIIVSAFRAKKLAEVGFMRDVNVTWIVGESGTGKSFTANQIINERGRDSVYFLTDYENGCFDSYMCEPVLFMDEYRGQFPYPRLLTMLDKYVHEEHARFCNVPTVWTEVYITSVKTPDEIYQRNVQDEYERSVDTFEQLKRRIKTIDYRWKDEFGYHEYKMPMSEYKNRRDLIQRAMRYEFQQIDLDIEMPFKQETGNDNTRSI